MHKPTIRLAIVSLALCMAGCAGPKVLPEAIPLDTTGPLAAARDDRIAVELAAVVVPNGPGSWAKDAAWDEYRVHVRSLSADELKLVRVTLFDALGNAVESLQERAALIDASEAVEQRYRAAGRVVESPDGGEGRLVTGVLAAGVGTGMLASLPSAAFISPGAIAAGVGLIAGASVLAVAGVAKLINNAETSSEIEARRTKLPAPVRGDPVSAVAFFPVVPLPSGLEVAYAHGDAERSVRIDTRSLTRLHVLHAPR